MAALYGGLDQPGPNLVLMKYATDRLSLVLSGTCWVNSGNDFDPDNTVPVPAGGFVRRIARTPHYDGVRKTAVEPAVVSGPTGVWGSSNTHVVLISRSECPN